MITEKVQNLFDFIDWLHSKVDYLLNQQQLVDELNEIRAEQNKLSPTKHFKDKGEYDRLQNLLLEKWPVVEAGIIAPIREKIEFYNIADISTPIINLNALGDLLELQRNYDEQDLLKIQKAKNQYIIYRIKTRWQPYFSFGLFFSDLDRDLYEYFKFFEEDNEVDFISDKTVKVENLEEAVQLLAGKREIGFFSMPKNFDVNADWETQKQQCISHNQSIYRRYETNLDNGKKQLSDLVFKMLNADKHLNSITDYDLLERQFNQIKSIFSLALNEKMDGGCIIQGKPFEPIERIFNELREFQKKTLSDIDLHLKTLEGLRKRDITESPLEAEPKDKKAKKINSSLVEYGFYTLEKVEILTDKSKEKIIEQISERGLPYAVAMLDYLGFFNHLLNKYCHTKERMYKVASEIISEKDSSRAIKGNLNTLNINSKEDRERYTAHQYSENVENYYQQLK